MSVEFSVPLSQIAEALKLTKFMSLKITRKLTYRLLKSTDRDLSLQVILNSLTTSEFRFSVIRSSRISAVTVPRLRKWLLTPFSALVLLQ